MKSDFGLPLVAMWVAVAVVGYVNPGAGAFPGFFAIIATAVAVEKD